MVFIGNIIWFILLGWEQAIIWLILALLFAITIVGLPIAKACLEFAKLSAFPFGKAVTRDSNIKGAKNKAGIWKVLDTILNIIWLPIGVIMAVIFFVIGLVSFLTIIFIPVGIVYIKMGKFVLWPFGVRVVPKSSVKD